MRFSPFDFEVYECPSCGYTMTVSVYEMIVGDFPCNNCGKRQVSEYVLLAPRLINIEPSPIEQRILREEAEILNETGIYNPD